MEWRIVSQNEKRDGIDRVDTMQSYGIESTLVVILLHEDCKPMHFYVSTMRNHWR